MINLKGKFRNQSALLIMGGASIIYHNYDLKKLSQMHDVIFLESKALTPSFIDFGIKPNYYIMFFTEKTYSNSLQTQFIQALSCNYDLENDIRAEYLDEWKYFKENFNNYLSLNNNKQLHKKYTFKENKFFKNSPFSLIGHYPKMNIISEQNNYNKYVSNLISLPNNFYKFTSINQFVELNDLNQKHFGVETLNTDKLLTFNSILDTVNSSSMYLYNILEYMGFSKCTIVGMDMSLIGSMEYSAQFTFKSMKNFKKFFNTCRQSYSYNFPRGFNKALLILIWRLTNKLIRLNSNSNSLKDISDEYKYNAFGLIDQFMRTNKQMNELKAIYEIIGNKYINIYDDYKYSLKLPVINNISYKDFIKY